MSDIKYTVVKGLDVASAMKASSGVTDAERKIKRLGGTIWEQTVVPVMEEIEKEGISLTKDTSKDGIQAIGEELKRIYANYMHREGIVIPETGKNRKGETFVIQNKKTGQPSYSQWSDTRRIWAYLGDIAKIIAYDKEALLYPEKNKVGARIDLLKMCKAQTSALENIQRLAGDLQGFLDIVEGGDALAAQTEVDALMVNNVPALEEASGLIRKLDRICGALEEGAEKDQVKITLLTMAQKHF